jgi:hypothetical protein
MRPQNQIARDRLDIALRRSPPMTAVALSEVLGVSVPSIHRMVREREADVIRQGATKSTKYALRRSLRGKLAAIPIYQINPQGQGKQIAMLDLVASEGALLNLAEMGWPVPKQHQGWWDGLPYPIYEMRPQGFLGRNFAHQLAQDFNVPENPEYWSDDDIVHILGIRGADCVGDLVVGDAAYQLWLKSQTLNNPNLLAEDALPDHYAQMATLATSQGVIGSSAGGEFPKFITSRPLAGSNTPHVIVKFSGVNNQPNIPNAVQRWSDLLICEHLALCALAQTTEIACAKSRVLFGQGRTFLEVERFDRVGLLGRTPVISLASLDHAFIGKGSEAWPVLMQRIRDIILLDETCIGQSQLLWWYGKLIANSDMHLGNLSFTFTPNQVLGVPKLSLTPVYDMLPMFYAPLAGGEVPQRQFMPELPLPQTQDAWQLARQAALQFWQMACEDTRISQPFRELCTDNFNKLNRLNV